MNRMHLSFGANECRPQKAPLTQTRSIVESAATGLMARLIVADDFILVEGNGKQSGYPCSSARP
jgi:hypothetical protein